MVVPSVVIQLETIAGASTALVVAGVLVGGVYRWYSKSAAADDEGDGEQKEVGFPLASWRYVYDVEKANAGREIAAVQEQAEDLSEVDREARR
jgi:high-affinity Fe2+/Pb2+ permease